MGGLAYNASTDCINIYNPKTGWKYYYWKKNKNVWYEKDITTAPTSYPALKAGESCYFVRSEASTATQTTLTLAGGVVPLDGEVTFDVDPGETKIITNPWPVPLNLGDFVNCWTDPVGGLAYNASTDCINIYNPKTGWKYYYWKKNKNVWYEKDITAAPTSYPNINPGEAFFFVRSEATASTKTTITFKGPEYKDPQ